MEVSPIIKFIVTDHRTELAVNLGRKVEVAKVPNERLLTIVNPATVWNLAGVCWPQMNTLHMYFQMTVGVETLVT